MGHKRSSLQKDPTELQKKIEHANFLQEEAKVHGSPSTLVAWVNELEVALKVIGMPLMLLQRRLIRREGSYQGHKDS